MDRPKRGLRSGTALSELRDDLTWGFGWLLLALALLAIIYLAATWPDQAGVAKRVRESLVNTLAPVIGNQEIARWLLSGIAVLAALVILRLLLRRLARLPQLNEMRINFTADLLVLFVLVLFVRSLGGLLHLASQPGVANRALTPAPVSMPLAVARLAGGPGLLSRGQWLDLSVMAPNSGQAESFSSVRVAGLRSKTGAVGSAAGTDPDTVMLSLDQDNATRLQAALKDDKAQVFYQVLAGSPTPPPATRPVTVTVTARPATPLPAPAAGRVNMLLPASKLLPQPQTIMTNTAQLVVVGQALPASTPPAPGAGSMPGRPSLALCVDVLGFLDANGAFGAGYAGKDTTQVLISIPRDRFDALAASLSAYDSLWLVNDQGCVEAGRQSTPSAPAPGILQPASATPTRRP